MFSKNIRFGALSAAGEPIPGCPVCDISVKMASVPRFGNQMGLRRRHQGRHRHYNSIWDSKQGSAIRIQNNTRKAGDRCCPTIQAGHTATKCIPLVGINGCLLGRADLDGTATRGFVTRCSCGGGTKVGAAITKATCHHSEERHRSEVL